jgi:hypothetical protein
MANLKELDKSYLNSIAATYNQLEKAYRNIGSKYKFDLTGTEITEAILERLKTYYITQRKIKLILDKRYLTAASDFFVESTLFFLKLYLLSKGGNIQAHSEKQIKKKKKAIRPDISIWKQNELIAIIECKTQFGWSRNSWERKFLDRERKLKKDFPKAKSFLLVMTGVNWGGFGSHKNLNNKYFCLLDNIGPTEYSISSQIMTPIEGLFKKLE